MDEQNITIGAGGRGFCGTPRRFFMFDLRLWAMLTQIDPAYGKGPALR